MMKEFQFISKADTLMYLEKKLKNAKILPMYTIFFETYKHHQKSIIDDIELIFNNSKLIIRSSSKNEDTTEQSLAGIYKSVLNIDSGDKKKLSAAIDEVFNSYHDKGNEKILVQPMLTKIICSGVAFTCDLDTLAPYYIVNYDMSEQSDSITGGYSKNSKMYIQFKSSKNCIEDIHLKIIIEALEELELILGNGYLDVEFGINENFEIYIFQVRPIVQKYKKNLSSLNLSDPLLKIHKKIDKLMKPHPNLLGNRTVFGVMPDWNPAEIIGIRPKQLSVSLYKELIMDQIWAYQRDNYGYRNLRSHPLMITFLGIPYIDVRVTFNSFIPKKLNENIAKKLMNYYIDKLNETPAYHDKVEFEIVFSCYYLSLPEKLKVLRSKDFSDKEIKQIEFTLLELTNQIIKPKDGLYKKDILKSNILEQKYNDIVNSELSIIDKIYWLLEDCKRYGTLPFAGVARAAFIAVQFLRSFVECNIITKEESNNFLNSLNTVNRQMNMDLKILKKGEMDKKIFLEKYGHIRPGTYDITSLRYDENFEGYFSSEEVLEQDNCTFTFSDLQKNQISNELQQSGIEVSVDELITFMRESIEGREYVKFIFTKSLSRCIELIKELGIKYNISNSDMAYLNVQKIRELYSCLDHMDLYDNFIADIKSNKQLYEYTKAVKLPSVILKADDIYQYHLLEEEPNFITHKDIIGECVIEEMLIKSELENKIILISSADPGYDFLFSKNIGGLITLFGGANSHMAIRCAELGIPAVIGVGESNFSKWKNAKVLEINCLNKQVKIID